VRVTVLVRATFQLLNLRVFRQLSWFVRHQLNIHEPARLLQQENLKAILLGLMVDYSSRTIELGHRRATRA
jgi:hypothetical protein